MIDPAPTSFTYTTYRQFCTSIRRIAFPAGVGETQKPMFDTAIVAALIKAQMYIDCLRKIQVSFFTKDQMFEQCGVARLLPPRGKVNLVYAFKPEAACLKHVYHPSTLAQIHCWSQKNSCSWGEPKGVGTEIYGSGSDICYEFGQVYPGETEKDTCWKPEPKWMARGRNSEIFLAPRLPCGYMLAVHWEGLRRQWSPLDAVPDDPELLDWVANYVQMELTTRFDRDLQVAAALQLSGREKFADMMYWCNEERRLQIDIDCSQGIDTGNLIDMFDPAYPYQIYQAPDVPTQPEEPEVPVDPTPQDPDGLKTSSTDYLGQTDGSYILLEQGGAVRIGDTPADSTPALSEELPIVSDPLGTPADKRLSVAALFDSAQSLNGSPAADLSWKIPVISNPSGSPTLGQVSLQTLHDFLEIIGAVLPDGIWAQYLPVNNGSSASGIAVFGDWGGSSLTVSYPTGSEDGFARFVGSGPNSGLQLQEYFLLDRTPHLDAHLSWFQGTQRMFVGFASDAAVWTSDAPAGDFLGFVASAPAGNTTIHCLARTGGVETRVNTGLSYTSVVWRRYEVKYDPDSGSATFFVDGVLVATITTNIPSHTTSMKCILACKNGGTDILDVSRATFATLR